MRIRGAVLLCLISAFGCGSDPAVLDVLTIHGGVSLSVMVDGGDEVLTVAFVSRVLPDGGLVPLLDAGVALNSVPLGTPDPEADFPGSLRWTRSGFQGATYGAQQTLSVLGANPPASVSFNCPQQVRFTAPSQGARVERTTPLILSWTQGGSPDWQILLTFSFRQPLEDGSTVRTFGTDVVAPGTLSYELAFPPEIAAVALEAQASIFLFVPGDSARADSGCFSVAGVDVVYPPGQPVPSGQ